MAERTEVEFTFDSEGDGYLATVECREGEQPRIVDLQVFVEYEDGSWVWETASAHSLEPEFARDLWAAYDRSKLAKERRRARRCQI